MTAAALKPDQKMFVYQVSPIDFWNGWIGEKEFLMSYVEDHTHGRYADLDMLAHRIKEYSTFREGALALAKRAGWEGDIRDGPYVAAMPYGDCESKFMIAWKQSSDGTTFIASPFRLPWLEEPARCWC